MESYDMTCFKVKLRKQGWSNDDVDALTKGVYDVRDLKEMKRIVDLAVSIVDDCYNDQKTKDSKILIHNMLKIFVQHQNSDLTEFHVQAFKDCLGWHFIVS
jgi:hypothetical protein